MTFSNSTGDFLKRFVTALFLLITICCQSDYSTSETERFIEPIKKEKFDKTTYAFDDIEFSASIVPIEYYLSKNASFKSTKVLNNVIDQTKNERIIEFEFESPQRKDLLGSDSLLSYSDQVKYLASNIKDDFTGVINDNDTIQCAGVHFERHYNVSPFHRLLIYFNGVPQDADLRLIYRDRLFNKGLMQFKLSNNPLQL